MHVVNFLRLTCPQALSQLMAEADTRKHISFNLSIALSGFHSVLSRRGAAMKQVHLSKRPTSTIDHFAVTVDKGPLRADGIPVGVQSRSDQIDKIGLCLLGRCSPCEPVDPH